MGVNDSIRAYNGVVSFLNKYDIPMPKKKTYRAKDNHLNGLLHEFAKEYNIKGMTKDNSPKYKGNFVPAMSSCCVVQQHWDAFVEWVNNNYKKKL